MTSIGNYAFSYCSGLTSIIIPDNVTTIGRSAFTGCTNLTSVTCKATSVPSTGISVFNRVPQNSVTLYVPASALEAYKTTTPWSDFGTIVALLDVLCEDVNGTDIQAIINLIVESLYDEKGDVNSDGVVNGTDIQEVINIIVNAE